MVTEFNQGKRPINLKEAMQIRLDLDFDDIYWQNPITTGTGLMYTHSGLNGLAVIKIDNNSSALFDVFEEPENYLQISGAYFGSVKGIEFTLDQAKFHGNYYSIDDILTHRFLSEMVWDDKILALYAEKLKKYNQCIYIDLPQIGDNLSIVPIQLGVIGGSMITLPKMYEELHTVIINGSNEIETLFRESNIVPGTARKNYYGTGDIGQGVNGPISIWKPNNPEDKF